MRYTYPVGLQNMQQKRRRGGGCWLGGGCSWCRLAMQVGELSLVPWGVRLRIAALLLGHWLPCWYNRRGGRDESSLLRRCLRRELLVVSAQFGQVQRAVSKKGKMFHPTIVTFGGWSFEVQTTISWWSDSWTAGFPTGYSFLTLPASPCLACSLSRKGHWTNTHHEQW